MSEFLAEASVLVRAETKAFRTELAAALATVPKSIEIPIVAVGGGSAAATRAQQVALQTAAVGSQKVSAAANAATRANDLMTASAKRIALGEKAAAAAANEVSAAQIRYRAQVAATTLAERANVEALTTTDPLLQKKTAALLASSQASEKDALATLSDARAEKIRIAENQKRIVSERVRTREITKGVQAQSASLLGLRGNIIGANAAFLAATAGAILFAKSVQSAAALESQLAVFKTTAGATADEMKRVGETARQLGSDVTLPAVGAQDAAEAITELSKAGLTVQDSMDGARGVLQLATAAAISNADAVQIAASALNAFGLAGDQAVRVADVLANSANLSQGSIADVGAALQQTAAVSRQVGLSFEDTVTFLTQLQRAGIRGSDAGTSLKVSLLKLVAPTKQAAAVLKELNVNVLDAQGKIRPDVFVQFANAQAGLAKSTQNLNARIVFGTDGIRTYAVAAREGTSGAAQIRTELDRQGSAAELAAARMTGLTGALENVKNQMANLGITLGQTVTPALTGIAQTAAETIGTFNDLVGPISSVVAVASDLRSKLVDLTTVNIGGIDIGLFATPFTLASQSAAKLASVLKDTEFQIGKSRVEVVKLVADLNKIGGPTKLNETVVRLQAMADKFSQGDEKSKQFSESLEKLIKLLQKAGETDVEGKFDIEIPPDVLSGKVGEDAGEATAEGFASGLRSKEVGFGAFLEGLKGPSIDAGTEQGKLFGEAWAAAAIFSVSEASQSALDLALAQASGNQQKELQVLLEQRRRQQKFLDAVLARPEAKTKKQANKDVELATKAAKNLEQTRAAIKRIFEDQAQKTKKDSDERERRAKEAEDARNKADQKILESFFGAQSAIDLAAISANASDSIAAQIRLQVMIANQASREFAIIDKTVKDQQTRAKALAERVKTLKAAAVEIDRLRQEAADAAVEKRRTAADVRQEMLGKQITLAGLREDRGAELAAINRAIAFARKRVRDYKKLGTLQIDEKIALEELINRRDDLLGTAKDGTKQGTTAFDLLKQFADTFRQVGGNLIGANQPFAGPTGFTADIAQFLVRRPGAQTTKPTAATAAAAKTPIELNDDRLVRSMDRLADVIERSGGNQTAGAPVSVEGQRWSAIGRYWEGRMTRDAIQANNG